MSIITFTCEQNEKETLKKGVWNIIHQHYFSTVFPNSNAEYEDEGKEVYSERLKELMEDELCKVNETEDGVLFEFDSTEDAGFSIADSVYGTSMGYSDNGLTYIDPIFENIIKEFPNICFEADTECADKWVYECNHYSYDGENLSKEFENEEFDGWDDESFENINKYAEFSLKTENEEVYEKIKENWRHDLVSLEERCASTVNELMSVADMLVESLQIAEGNNNFTIVGKGGKYEQYCIVFIMEYLGDELKIKMLKASENEEKYDFYCDATFEEIEELLLNEKSYSYFETLDRGFPLD